MTTNDYPKQNTDRELWRESDDRSQCTPSIHVTQDGGIGINVGGTVIVRPIREWHALAAGATNARRIANVADFMAEDDDEVPAPAATPQPIIAKPETPPFEPKQFVRIKSSGTIINVASCEKRVVHGALRWVVDGLNGMRAFADDCELASPATPKITERTPMNVTVGEAMGIALALHEAMQLLSWFIANANMTLASNRNSSDETWYTVLKGKVEQAQSLKKDINESYFTPTATPPAPVIRYACSKAAAVGDTVKMISASNATARVDSILQNGEIRVQRNDGSYETFPAYAFEFVPEPTAANQHRSSPESLAAEQELRDRLAVAKLLLGQCDNRMFLVGEFELRKAAGGWKLVRPPYGALVGNDLKAQVFTDPVQAALRAKELAGVGKAGAT